MTVTLCNLLGRDLGGYKLVNATMLELDHGLMGCFPAMFCEPEGPIIFTNDSLLGAAKERLGQRKSKTRQMLFLLDRGGASGFVLEGDKPYAHTRSRVYTRHDYDTNVAIEWAPGLLSLS